MILQFRGKYSRRARHVVPAHLVQDPIRILPIKIYTRRISRLGSGHRYAPISEAFSSRKCHRVGLAASSSGKFWKWSPANCSFTQDRAPDRSSRCCMPCPTRYTISGAETCQDFIEKKDWSLKLGGRGGEGDTELSSSLLCPSFSLARLRKALISSIISFGDAANRWWVRESGESISRNQPPGSLFSRRGKAKRG